MKRNWVLPLVFIAGWAIVGIAAISVATESVLPPPAKSWIMWTDQLGQYQKVSKIRSEGRCYLLFEAWMNQRNISISTQPTTCEEPKPEKVER